MKIINTYQLLLLLILFPTVLLNAQTTYTWIGANNGQWTTSSNWSPTRTAPATNDILQFTDGTTKNVTNIPAQTIGRLLVNSNTNITLQSSGTVTLTVGNGAGDDIVIASGSSVTIGGLNALTVTLATSATADVSGTLTINTGKTYNTAGTTVITTVTGGIVNSGTITTGLFGGAKLVFLSSSSYQHSQDGGAVPASTWNANSTCLITGVTSTSPTGIGQSFAHFGWNCPGQTVTATLGLLFTVSGNFTLNSTGSGVLRLLPLATTTITGNYSHTGGTFSIAPTFTQTLNIGGNFSISGGTFLMSGDAYVGTLNVAGNFSQTGGTIDETSTGNGLIVFNGMSNQSYTGGGTISNTINFTINNPAGITLLTSVAFPAGLTMTNGNINLNGNILTLGTGTTNTGTLSWTNGFMVGSGLFTRWHSTTSITLGNVLGLFPMGNGTENRSVWIAGTPSTGGTISVQHTNATGTTALLFVENSQTFDKRTNMSWTLSSANGFAGSTLSLRIQSSGIPGINAVSDLNISLASTAASGTYVAPGGTTTNPQVNRTDLTQATLANTFYFAATSASPLPVELSSFSAIALDNSVKLNWRTETEVSNYGFEVEKLQDYNIEKLQDWSKIGFVQGHGNSNSPKDYSFLDENVSGGKYSYRLKQIDIDGKFEYSKVVEVDLDSPTKFELSQNYPNPFNPSTTISFSLPQSGNVKLTVYNLLGEQVAELVNGFRGAGVHSMNFTASNLNSGLYIYKIEASDFVQARKMTLIK